MTLRITLGQLLHDHAARFGERPCITMAPSGETLSYAGLESLVNRVAHGFRDGIAGGRLNAGSGPVAVMLENGIPYLAMSYALKKIDLVDVSINRARCRSVMAKFMVPAIVTILEEMPRTVTGKPEKGKLAALSV